MASQVVRAAHRLSARVFYRRPARALAAGYLLYIGVGWGLLSLPAAQRVPVAPVDNLFIATSAVSTTGLVSVDPGTTYTGFGQFIILMLIQLGGLGYMTVGSLAVLALRGRFSPERARIGRAVFGLPDGFETARFLRAVLLFTASIEAVGAFLLYLLFRDAGQAVGEAAWSAVFHAVSAFCTAGFSLYADSFVRFSGNGSVLVVISVLSILGAIGFIVLADVVRKIFDDGRPLSLTSVLSLSVTTGFILLGTILFLFLEPRIAALPPKDQASNALFQAMTAATTVGFNSIDTAAYAPMAIVFTYLLMLVGASPAGTGGGLKTTTVGIMIATCLAVIRQKNEVVIAGRRIPQARVIQSFAVSVFWGVVLLMAMLLLTALESARFDVLLFEAISALATVGLSLGATASLSEAGKLVIVALMALGRIGVLAFFVALAMPSRAPEPAGEQDVLI